MDTISRQSSIDEPLPPAVMYQTNELETPPNGLGKKSIIKTDQHFLHHSLWFFKLNHKFLRISNFIIKLYYCFELDDIV